MSRQSISFTAPNTKWLKRKVDIEDEYRSNSEAVNDAIRRMREAEAEAEAQIKYIRTKLIASEQSGFTDLTREQILQKSREELRER